jgi:sugar O-acyltransferase (sialic acid O-acetyltransferase NeuD family)
VKLAILGASGLAREAVAVAEALAARGSDVEVIGFIDVAQPAGTVVAGLPVLGDETWFSRAEAQDVLAVPAMGAPAIRRRSVAAVLANGGGFASLVHPSVEIGPRVSLGQGCLLLPMSSLTADITIEDYVSINPGCTLGHDAYVESYVNLSPGVRLSGYVRVEEGADLGAGVVVLPGLRVGRNAVVGAGAVAVREVPPDATVVGVPARPLVRSS